ncbi:MAG: hypothetical protein DYH06_23090, partial [Acidobacteria bacterium ACB2]|nr:hypothetical protein [Acidobacteria bacterium ACB2]
FSIDGASQDTYVKYRQRGNFDKAMANLRAMTDEKRKAGRDVPHLNWRYILFNWNDSDEEMNRARQIAAEVGVDRLCWEITDHPEDSYSRRFGPGTPDYERIRHEVWDMSGLGNAIPGTTPRAQIAVRTFIPGLPLRAKAAQPVKVKTRVKNLSARPFLLELDRLVAGASGGRVTAEAAARLVADEKKEYGSDFVEAVAQRRFVPALRLLEKLMAADDFAAFRPFGKDAAGPAPGAKKGPRGEAAFFPLLGLLAGEVRRMLALKAAAAEAKGGDERIRRADYRTFVDRVLPVLKSPRPGGAPVPVDGHPFVLHRSWLAAQEWTLGQLVAAMEEIAAIDEGVKSGAGTGPELLEAFLLARAEPAGRANGSRRNGPARSS